MTSASPMVRIGRPSARFGHPWTVARWVEGDPADRVPVTRADAARTLADFLAALHTPAPADAPANPVRGVPLSALLAKLHASVFGPGDQGGTYCGNPLVCAAGLAVIETLVQPFQFPFMQAAFAVAAIIAVPTALLSCFLVLKGWSLMGDAVSHAVLPGIVLAYVLGLPLIVGAFAAGMVCSMLTGYLQANSRVKQDTVMGVVFSGMFGLGTTLLGKVQLLE